MKNLAILLSLSFIFSMCQNKRKAIEVSELKNDSLQLLINKKDSALYSFLDAFNEIESNLNSIKEKENIITIAANDKLEDNVARTEKINNDIQVIYNLMLENKNKLHKLENNLKQSKINKNKLQKTIELLNSRLLDKDVEIIELLQKLKQMNIKVAKMNYQIDTLLEQNQQNIEKLELQDQTIKTAFYVVGTAKELKEMGILTKGKIFSKSDLNDDFKKEYFTQINILQDTVFSINCKKIQIVTSHPSNSYELINGDTKQKIGINDPWEFWSISKYLIVIIK